jgi:hypothetical protein
MFDTTTGQWRGAGGCRRPEPSRVYRSQASAAAAAIARSTVPTREERAKRLRVTGGLAAGEVFEEESRGVTS